MKSIALAIAFVVTNTIPRWISGINGDVFCKWQAISISLLVLAGLAKGKGKIETIVWNWTFLLAINNMIDELFGVASEVSAAEIIFATLVTLWTVYRIIKCQSNNNT